MGSIVAVVMPKSVELDPLGRAVSLALTASGAGRFTDVRQGKRYVFTVEGAVTDDDLRAARRVAERLLMTPGVDEIVSLREAGDATDLDDDVDTDWDDMPDTWGGDEVRVDASGRTPRVRQSHRIDETMLGEVQSGSYYGRADDVMP